MALALASRAATCVCARSVSTIWSPMVITGLSENFGSCSTMAMRPPRSSRLCRGVQCRRSTPLNASRLAATRASGAVRPRIARPVCVLPEPDSPTMPSRSRPSVNETPRTASVRPPSRLGNETRRSSTTSIAILVNGTQFISRLGIERVAQAVTQKVEGEAHHEDGRAGRRRDPPVIEHVEPSVGDHGAPFGHRRLRAEAQEAQARRGENDARHVQRDADDHRGHAQRHDVAQDDPPRRRADQLHGGDVVGAPNGERLGARDPRIRRPRRDRDGEHRVLDAGTERCDEGERQDETREREEDVGDAHQRRVDEPSRITRDGTHDKPDGCGQDGHQNHDKQRDARAEDDARKDVAALVVGAEPVRGRRRQQARGAQVADVRRVRGQHVGEHGRQHQADHDQQGPASRGGCARTCATRRTRARRTACRRERGRSDISQSCRLSRGTASLPAALVGHRACFIARVLGSSMLYSRSASRLRPMKIEPTTIVAPSTAFMSAFCSEFVR